MMDSDHYVCLTVGESIVRGTRSVHEVLEETHAEVSQKG